MLSDAYSSPLCVHETYFVRRLRFQFAKNVLRLRLGCERGHGEDWVGMVLVGSKGVELGGIFWVAAIGNARVSRLEAAH
jgi:hypothetical protein